MLARGTQKPARIAEREKEDSIPCRADAKLSRLNQLMASALVSSFGEKKSNMELFRLYAVERLIK